MVAAKVAKKKELSYPLAQLNQQVDVSKRKETDITI